MIFINPFHIYEKVHEFWWLSNSIDDNRLRGFQEHAHWSDSHGQTCSLD
jgi:hypothetical protein